MRWRIVAQSCCAFQTAMGTSPSSAHSTPATIQTGFGSASLRRPTTANAASPIGSTRIVYLNRNPTASVRPSATQAGPDLCASARHPAHAASAQQAT